jgi:hypothetical protein
MPDAQPEAAEPTMIVCMIPLNVNSLKKLWNAATDCPMPQISVGYL